jgi:hypothetical protein
MFPVKGENRYHIKLSLNSTNNLNYKKTSPEFIAGKYTHTNNDSTVKYILTSIIPRLTHEDQYPLSYSIV